MNYLKIKNNIFKIFIELFIFNKKKRSILKARYAKYNLQRYTKFALTETFKVNNEKVYKEENDEYIWQYWHQNINNAPLLIKKCFDSVKKYENDKKINVLSYETIKDYVEIPQSL